MDRRQRKSREAIFTALTGLLAKKDFRQITVGEIIEQADVGRATFYAHFETKEYLLKELCEELFCHIFDAAEAGHPEHRHIFSCDAPDSVFLHLFQHLSSNDHQILQLLSGQELFVQYFKTNLENMVADQLPQPEAERRRRLPEGLWLRHVSATFIETVRWWADHGLQETPEAITEYFFLLLDVFP